MAAAGLDHVCCGDHVSFFTGAGFDGLLHAAMMAALNPRLAVHTGVYLLPLRHPVLVARQLADLERLWPGRLVFGVGIGGEDRHEVQHLWRRPGNTGEADGRVPHRAPPAPERRAAPPSTESSSISTRPSSRLRPAAPTPIIVGGRSDAAIRRAGRLGDGWLGIWNSPRRFAQAVDLAAQEAERVGRPDPPKRHAMQVWCGLARTREAARAALAPAMESFYQVPFERFERYSPYGTAEDVAEFLAPYVEAGCSAFNLIPQAVDEDELIAATAAVKKLLDG